MTTKTAPLKSIRTSTVTNNSNIKSNSNTPIRQTASSPPVAPTVTKQGTTTIIFPTCPVGQVLVILTCPKYFLPAQTPKTVLVDKRFLKHFNITVKEYSFNCFINNNFLLINKHLRRFTTTEIRHGRSKWHKSANC